MAQKFTLAVFLVLFFVTLMAPPTVEARDQDGLLSGILGGRLLNIRGTLYCTLNGAIGVNGTATPVFSRGSTYYHTPLIKCDALVQLKCAAGNIVSSATTGADGTFSMILSPLQFLLSSVLQECKLVVPTPLSTCNSSLPDIGGLVSLLQSVGSLLVGIIRVLNLIPTGFGYIPVL